MCTTKTTSKPSTTPFWLLSCCFVIELKRRPRLNAWWNITEFFNRPSLSLSIPWLWLCKDRRAINKPPFLFSSGGGGLVRLYGCWPLHQECAT
jgi:hypothetical protein